MTETVEGGHAMEIVLLFEQDPVDLDRSTEAPCGRDRPVGKRTDLQALGRARAGGQHPGFRGPYGRTRADSLPR